MVEISSDEDVDPNDVPSVFNNQPSGFVVAPRENTKAIPVPPLTAVSSSVVCCRSPLREICQEYVHMVHLFPPLLPFLFLSQPVLTDYTPFTLYLST